MCSGSGAFQGRPGPARYQAPLDNPSPGVDHEHFLGVPSDWPDAGRRDRRDADAGPWRGRAGGE